MTDREPSAADLRTALRMACWAGGIAEETTLDEETGFWLTVARGKDPHVDGFNMADFIARYTAATVKIPAQQGTTKKEHQQ
ncbi:MAG: hypothetical protein GY929_25610 [Actinomycetia bacterium]|nr:hypothetical protein [Actinomycetes bacterium]